MTRRTLLAISAELQSLDDLLSENGGDVSDPVVEAAINQWFFEFQGELEAKADNYAALITEMEVRAAMRKTEADRMAKLAKADSGAARFLKDRLKFALEQRGIKKLERSPTILRTGRHQSVRQCEPISHPCESKCRATSAAAELPPQPIDR